MLNFLNRISFGEWIVIAIVIFLLYGARKRAKSQDKDPSDSKDETEKE